MKRIKIMYLEENLAHEPAVMCGSFNNLLVDSRLQLSNIIPIAEKYFETKKHIGYLIVDEPLHDCVDAKILYKKINEKFENKAIEWYK